MTRSFLESCHPLGPLVKRHVLPELPGQPPEVRLGWAQLGDRLGIGLFPDSRRFSLVALADAHGRVFLSNDPKADVFDSRPVFQFVRDDDDETERSVAGAGNVASAGADGDPLAGGSSAADDGPSAGNGPSAGDGPAGSGPAGDERQEGAGRGDRGRRGDRGAKADGFAARGSLRSAANVAGIGKGLRGLLSLRGLRTRSARTALELDAMLDRIRPSLLMGRDARRTSPHEGTVYGNVLALDDHERMMWLASWSKQDNLYTLEQMRPELDASLREGLEYRDAITIAFFTAFLLPRMRGLLVGFGTGNIFRRLRTEAPIGAIRRAARDTVQARSMNLRVSGLEEYFSHLMAEAGAFDQQPGLEAVHGAEPLHLFTSSYSGSFVFAWHGQMAFKQVMTVLRIEGNLNRFSQVSAWLERNARLLRASGVGATGAVGPADAAGVPGSGKRTDAKGARIGIGGRVAVEDNADDLEVARIDDALLDNPALSVLRPYAPHGRQVPFDPVREDGTGAAYALYEQAAATRSDGSEWSYRQRLSSLLRRMRLPYRFDVDFRSNLSGGEVAMAFTSAGSSMMPKTRFDASSHLWRTLDDADRERMSARYNLRVGLMFAALAFGIDERVRDVHLQIDSVGLEDEVSTDGDDLSQLYSDVIQALGHARNGHGLMGRGSKGDPKDGDLHGNPGAAAPGAPEGHGHDSGDGDRSETDGHDGMASGGMPSGKADGPVSGPVDGDAVKATDASRVADDAKMTETPRSEGSESSEEPVGAAAGAETRADGVVDAQGVDTTDADAQGAGGDGDDIDRTFDDLMSGIDLDESIFSLGAESNAGDGDGSGAQSDGGAMGDAAMNGGEGRDDGDPDDPMESLHDSPVTRHLVSVRFERGRFLDLLATQGLNDPVAFYRQFEATMDLDDQGGLREVEGRFDLSDARFAPHGSQEEPELSGATFDADEARTFGARDAMGLSIQRADVLQRAVNDFHRLAAADMPSVEAAHEAMALVRRIDDPELNDLSSQVTAALIDGKDTPDLRFALSEEIDAMRLKARDMLFSGSVEKAIETASDALKRLDAVFVGLDGVPRYFNSYAERVVYNRLFATSGETTVLIPDNLFYAHMELADVLGQISGADAALPHLNAMVQYAPAYPLAHMRLAVQLARKEDWAGARAATLNALRVSLDGADAAYAYYRYAYAEWMRDDFALAAAGYVMADHIKPGAINALEDELSELLARADSQCIEVPRTPEQAAAVLRMHGVPVWPETDVLPIVDEAARMAVDRGLFVPARTLSLASARMHGDGEDGLDIVQAQFLRSLNA